MLGRAVSAAAGSRGQQVQDPGRRELDLVDTAAVVRRIQEFRPQLVVNCAAFTDVDGCESRSEEAWEINGRAVARLGAEIERLGGCRLLHVSTDYVFDGRGSTPYREDDETDPQTVYGASKRLAEVGLARCPRSTVVRTSWLFGPGGRNFVRTIAARARDGVPLRVVADQHGCPTYTPFLASALLDLGDIALDGDGLPPIVHYRNRDPVSWHGLACAVVRQLGVEAMPAPVTTAEMPRPASRPAYSVLDVERFERICGRQVEDWRQGLDDYQQRWLEDP